MFQGLLFSILLNDAFRILWGDFGAKPVIEYGVASAVTLAPLLSNRLVILDHAQNNYYMGLGMMLGTWLANKSEEKKIKI